MAAACANELVRRQHWVVMLKWLQTNGCTMKHCCVHAAKGDNFEVVKWAREQGCPGENLICEGAAEGGHIEVLKWAKASSSA